MANSSSPLPLAAFLAQLHKPTFTLHFVFFFEPMQHFNLFLPFLYHPGIDLSHRYFQQMHHALLSPFFLYIFADGPDLVAISASEVKPQHALLNLVGQPLAESMEGVAIEPEKILLGSLLTDRSLLFTKYLLGSSKAFPLLASSSHSTNWPADTAEVR